MQQQFLSCLWMPIMKPLKIKLSVPSICREIINENFSEKNQFKVKIN